jgi:hypothetical protein
MATQINLTTGTSSTTVNLALGGRGPAGADGSASVDQASITAAITNKATFAADNNLQTEIEVKSANFTAAIDGMYHAVATLTVTDPASPVEGKGFTVLIRNGTATIGGTAYANAGSIVRRVWHSGSYANYLYRDATAYATALGANDNYVTDAEKAALHPAVTVSGNGLTLSGQGITLDIGAGLNVSPEVEYLAPDDKIPVLDASDDYSLAAVTPNEIWNFLADKVDGDILTYKIATGAPDLSVAAQLAIYLKSQNLWASSVFWACELDQNKTSGATNSSLGGISADLNLGGGYARKNGGILCDSTAAFYATLTGLQTAAALTVITSSARSHEAEAESGIGDFRMAFGSASAGRQLSILNTSANITGETVAIFARNGATRAIGTTSVAWVQGENTVESIQFSTAGTKLWIDGSPITLGLTSGMTTSSDSSPNSTGFTSNNNLYIANRAESITTTGLFGLLKYVVVVFGNLTDAQNLAISQILKSKDASNRKSLCFWGDSLTETKHSGFTNTGATIRITPPAVRYYAEYGSRALGFGISGQTASQIAARATASATYSDYITVIWAGTNDRSNSDFDAVVDSISSIVSHIGHSRYIVVTPLKDTAWTSEQKANLDNIRAEIIARFPDNYLDSWAVTGTTDGAPDTGYRRYNSAGVEDSLHPNDTWNTGFIANLNAFITGKGW